MLINEAEQTMDLAHTSLLQSKKQNAAGDLYVESLGVTEEEKKGILHLAATKETGIDPVVSFLVGATNGIAYKHLIGKLNEYPIPALRLPPPPPPKDRYF